jgi:hypothetical protein
MRSCVIQGRIVSPVLFILYVNDISTPSRHVELAIFGEDTVLVAKSRSPFLLVKYLEAYHCRLEHWLQDWRISINVSKNAVMLFTMRCIQRTRPIQFLGELIACVETAR